jgi:very-short-patch-repair endonuclease
MSPSPEHGHPPNASPEAVLLRIARDGVVTRAAALEAGLGTAVLKRRLKTGFLIRMAPGVYRLAGTELAARTAERGALAATSGRALGLYSALAGHGVVARGERAKVHVLIDHTRQLQQTSWYTAHRTRRLEPHEITTRGTIAMTTMPRAIRDLAAFLPHRQWADTQLERWVEEALQLRRMTLNQLEIAARQESADQVRVRLNRLTQRQRGGDPAVLKSIGETWLRDLIIRRGLPMPEFNVRPFLDSLTEVDAFWRHVPLIIEFDGFTFHKTRSKHDKDRRRDRRAWRRHVPVIRITDDDFENDLPALEDDITQFVTGAVG